MQKHRGLRLILRLDQAGSAAFIVIALGIAPALVVVAPLRTVLLWLVGAVVIAYAIALAVLGIFMACGLSRAMARGDELSTRMWRSIIGFPAGQPKDVPIGVGEAGEDEQQIGQAVEVLGRERVGAGGVRFD